MPLLADLKGMFSRRKPVILDLSTSQAASLTRTTQANPDINIEAKPDPATTEARLLPTRSKASGPNLDEVLTIVGQISSHLEAQTTRTDRLIECMERLPAALDALPEINRQNAHLLEVVSGYLDHARHRDNTLNETLGGITKASNKQTEVLGLLQQQLDSNSQATTTMTASLATFNDAIGDLAGSNRRTTTVLKELNRSSEQRENDLTRMLGRTNRWMLVAMLCCAAASATAIAVAAVAIFGGQ